MNPLSTLSNTDYTLQTARQKMQSADVYTDINSLQSLKSLDDRDAALRQVAQQFESQFLHMMIKSMRDANAVFEQDSMFSSNESRFYRDMHDHQMALSLAQGSRGGIGIADALYNQLKATNPVEKTAINSLPVVNASLNTSGTDSLSSAFSGSPEEFTEWLRPMVSVAAEKLGVHPDILVAQSALETGWGKHVIKNNDGSSSFNLFNIKASRQWEGNTVEVPTLEYRQGALSPELAKFKSYDDPQQSIDDYVSLISQNPRYQQALNADAETYIRQLQTAGYATDPDYSEKVLNIHARVSELPVQPVLSGQG